MKNGKIGNKMFFWLRGKIILNIEGNVLRFKKGQ